MISALLRRLGYLAGYGTLGIVLTLVTGFGIHLANLPPLMPRHLVPLQSEFRAADAPKFASLDDYRAAEARLMAELDAEVYATAREFDAQLLTCDAHFEKLPGAIVVKKGGSRQRS